MGCRSEGGRQMARLFKITEESFQGKERKGSETTPRGAVKKE